MTQATGSEMLSLAESAAFELFRTVQTLERWRLIAHILFFITAIISLFTTNYILYLVSVIALITSTIAFLFRLIANHRNILGHSLHRISMLAKAYRISGDYFDVAYLLPKIPSKLHRAALKAAKSTNSSGSYTSPTSEPGAELLRWMIQENAYFNAALYDACADRALRNLFIFTIFFLLLVLLIIPITDGAIEYMTLRIILVILSLAVLYEQVERWAAWRFASRVMRDLENELARFKTVPEHRILLLFSNYQVVICSTPEIDKTVYEDNRKKLNSGWQQREATLHKEWANGA